MRLIDADELNEYIGRESLDTREKIFALVDRMPTLPNPCGKPCAFERPQWIPCSERLPEKDGRYLVKWYGDWGVYVCIAKYSQSGKYWLDNDGYELREIYAWMPLPEPYEKEGDMDG